MPLFIKILFVGCIAMALTLWHQHLNPKTPETYFDAFMAIYLSIAIFKIFEWIILYAGKKINLSSFLKNIEVKKLRKRYIKLLTEKQKCEIDKTNLTLIIEGQLSSAKSSDLHKETVFDVYLKKLERLDRKKESLEFEMNLVNMRLRLNGTTLFSDTESEKMYDIHYKNHNISIDFSSQV